MKTLSVFLLGLGPSMVLAAYYPYLDMRPIEELEAELARRNSSAEKRDDEFWSMSFHDGGCNGPANFGAFSNQLYDGGVCSNFNKSKPWDSIVLGLHDDFEMYLFDNEDCCLGTPNDDEQPCAIFHVRQEGTCIQEPIVPKSVLMVKPIHAGASPNGARGSRDECSQASNPAACPNDDTASCTLSMFKQINAATGFGSTPMGYVSGSLTTDQQCNSGNNPVVLESCSSAALEGHYVFRKNITHLPDDIDIYITGQSGKTLDGYFEYYLHGQKQHIDFNTCEVDGSGYVGFSNSGGNTCHFPCDFANPVPDPVTPGASLPDCFYTG